MKDLTEQLDSLPGIGKSLAEDLRGLGYSKSSDLKGENPELMYEKLCAQAGTKLDRCVLYTFRCAVAAVSGKYAHPEALLWWNFMDKDL